MGIKLRAHFRRYLRAVKIAGCYVALLFDNPAAGTDWGLWPHADQEELIKECKQAKKKWTDRIKKLRVNEKEEG